MIKTDKSDFSCSIETLEGVAWGEPDPDATEMVKSIYALREKPLGCLTDDEVRLAISQDVGIPFVLDLAFQRLEADPLLEGSCYPGDILSALIRADGAIWRERSDLHTRLAGFYEYAVAQPAEINELFRDSLGLPDHSAIN